jgi:hypothetical protein
VILTGRKQYDRCLDCLSLASGTLVLCLNTAFWGWSAVECLTTTLAPGTTPWAMIWFCLGLPIVAGVCTFAVRASTSRDSYFDVVSLSLLVATVLSIPCLLLAVLITVV